jgi:hypothetical protein
MTASKIPKTPKTPKTPNKMSDLDHAIHELECARESVDALRVPMEGKKGEPSKANRQRYEVLTKACATLEEVVGSLQDIDCD